MGHLPSSSNAITKEDGMTVDRLLGQVEGAVQTGLRLDEALGFYAIVSAMR
jgi:hypothetical protein